MALVPEICAAFKQNCSILVTKDTTDSYNVDTNTTGYGSPNIAIGDVDSALVYIETPNLESLEPIDVIDSLPASVTGTFTLAETEVTAQDGEWIIRYELVVGSTTYTKTIKIFSSCLVRCCIDKMWSKYAEGAIEDCDCGCGKDVAKTALEAEALYRAMLSSAACLDATARNTILKKIQRLCELQNCNCR